MILDVDPIVDYAFKHLFGRETTRPLLIDLLDSVLNPAPGHHIRDVELLNPFNPKEAFDDKLSILDVKARDQSGRQFNVEMQMRLTSSFKNRIVYYQAKYHQQQLHQGEEYRVLRPTISIVFLNEVLFPEVPDWHLQFQLLELRHHFAFTNDLEVHTLELPKFKKADTALTSSLDNWLYFLRHAEKMDSEALPETLRQPLIQRAVEELKMLTQSDIERERYEARRKAQLDYNSGLADARLEGKAEGEKEGLAEGEKKGLAEGEKKGTISAIHLCERLLQRPETPTEQLERKSLEDLVRLTKELESQLLSRK